MNCAPDIGPLELLILQPTPFCNLDCDYCYLPNRQDRRVMREEVLRLAFRRVLESRAVQGDFTVVWHAGEPLVLPVEFYRRAMAVAAEENRSGVRIGQAFQTNATLVTEEWCEFLRQDGVSIGVSVDGPDFLHDRHRKTRRGDGTWKKVRRGIDLLNREHVPFHVITVLTAESLDFADELFEFYAEHGIRQISFNVEEIEGPHLTSSLSGEAAEMRFREFLARFYDLAAESGERYSVREFDSAYAAILSRDSPAGRAGQQAQPFGIISIDCEGNISTFSPELLGLPGEAYGGFSFGNVHTHGIEVAMASPNYRRVAGEIAAGVERCRQSCEYFDWCGGGAPGNKLFENGSFDSAETMFCRLSRQAPIDLVMERMERQLSARA